MKIKAAVLEHTGAGFTIEELDLAPPRRGEVLVRMRASGVCHSDWNAVDGTAETRCPAVLGHEGAGVVEALGEGVEGVRIGDHVTLSWAPSCGRCEECIHDAPQLCETAWPAMETGGLLDGTTRLSRAGGEPIYHYSPISSSSSPSGSIPARRMRPPCVVRTARRPGRRSVSVSLAAIPLRRPRSLRAATPSRVPSIAASSALSMRRGAPRRVPTRGSRGTAPRTRQARRR